MALAPVIDLAARIRIELHRLGVGDDRIYATASIAELSALYRREKAIASMTRLTGQPRSLLELWDTPELEEIEHRTVRRMMGQTPSHRDSDHRITCLPGHMPATRHNRRAQANRAWNISA